MSEKIKRIGILTSGGDAPGMNAVIRGVVRTALKHDIKVKGILRGYNGLLKREFINMESHDVSDIIQRGGTILYTDRCEKFETEEGQKLGAQICKENELDSLVVIGGDGSIKGGQKLVDLGINVIAVPGTIDLDIACTDYTIGFDTAVNTAMNAIDKVKDTSTSHERCSIIEVMGRDSGYIALWCGIANGAEDIFIPGLNNTSEEQLVENIIANRKKGKKHYIIINAEGIGGSETLAEKISKATGIDTRASILGHLQRGGSPTAKDRVIGSMIGSYAVDLLCQGKKNKVIAFKDGGLTNYHIHEAISMKKTVDDYQYKVHKILSQ